MIRINVNVTNLKPQTFQLSRTFRKLFVVSVLLTLIFMTLQNAHIASSRGVVEFGETKIENHYPQGMRFSVKITTGGERGTVWLYYQLGNTDWLDQQANCQAKLVNNEVEYYSCIAFIDLEDLPPQIPLNVKWRLYGTVESYSDEIFVIYEDQTYQWDSLTQDDLTVWWHDRPLSFGEEAILIAKQTLIAQQDFYGIELETPLQIVIINNLDEYNTWNIELEYQSYGEAYPQYGLTVQVIEDTAPQDWMTMVFAHEISHVLFFHTINQNRTHPNWLNEGLAVYQEPRNHTQEWLLVEAALSRGEIIPLGDLRDSFGGTNVALAYAQSYTAVEYLLETYGKEGLATLFAEYQNGKSTDEAFVGAFNRTLAEFEEDWLIWLMERRGSTIDRFLLPYYIFLGCCCFSILVALVIALTIYSRKSKLPN